MGNSFRVRMGHGGRITLPKAVRRRTGIDCGTELVVVDSAAGILLLTREQLEARARSDVAPDELLATVLAEREDGS